MTFTVLVREKRHFFNAKVAKIEKSMLTFEPDIQHRWKFAKPQGGGELILSLKLGPGNVLDGLHWEASASAQVPQAFDNLHPFVLGKDIHELLQWTRQDLTSLSSKDFLFLPLEYLKEAIRFHSKIQLTWPELRGTDPHDLVCRCFGVSGGEIRKLIREQKIRRPGELFRQTQASSACQSCQKDVVQILREERSKLSEEIAQRLGDSDQKPTSRPEISGKEMIPKWDSQGRRNVVGEKTPAEWILELDAHLREFWPKFQESLGQEFVDPPKLRLIEGNQVLWAVSSPETRWLKDFEEKFGESFHQSSGQYFSHSVHILKK